MIHSMWICGQFALRKQMFLEANIRRFCRSVNGESQSKLALVIS